MMNIKNEIITDELVGLNIDNSEMNIFVNDFRNIFNNSIPYAGYIRLKNYFKLKEDNYNYNKAILCLVHKTAQKYYIKLSKNMYDSDKEKIRIKNKLKGHKNLSCVEKAKYLAINDHHLECDINLNDINILEEPDYIFNIKNIKNSYMIKMIDMAKLFMYAEEYTKSEKILLALLYNGYDKLRVLSELSELYYNYDKKKYHESVFTLLHLSIRNIYIHLLNNQSECFISKNKLKNILENYDGVDPFKKALFIIFDSKISQQWVSKKYAFDNMKLDSNHILNNPTYFNWKERLLLVDIDLLEQCEIQKCDIIHIDKDMTYDERDLIQEIYSLVSYDKDCILSIINRLQQNKVNVVCDVNSVYIPTMKGKILIK